MCCVVFAACCVLYVSCAVCVCVCVHVLKCMRTIGSRARVHTLAHTHSHTQACRHPKSYNREACKSAHTHSHTHTHTLTHTHKHVCTEHVCRVGQNRIYTPYMTVYLVISLPKIPCILIIYYICGSGQPYMCVIIYKQNSCPSLLCWTKSWSTNTNNMRI